MTQKLTMALEEFGKKLGLDNLALNADQTLALALDDVEVALVHLEAANEAHFYTIIGAMPDDVTPAFQRLLLSANHMGGMTNGAALGYDPEEGVVTLNRRLPVDVMNAGFLENFLEEFVNLTEMWRENFKGLIEADLQATMNETAVSKPLDSSDAWVRI